MSEQDTVLLTMLKLKDNWSLTGDLAKSNTTTGSGVKFNTRWYDEKIGFPQVVVAPVSSSAPRVMEMGSNPTYQHAETIKTEAWVRYSQDSNTSLGWAKNAIYSIKKEIDRILESGSTFSSGGINFFYTLGAYRIYDDMRIGRPPILRLQRETTVNYYNKRK